MTWLGDHWLSLFGWAGSALLIVSLLQTRVLRFRFLNLSACVSLAIFNALVEVWPMVGMNLATTVINLYFLLRLLRERHDEAAFEVLPMATEDSYLRHFLTVHDADLRKHFPSYAGTGADDLAFGVLRGDETVGVVVVRADAGDSGTAQVLVDYVTPRFRDFSPGEFVWRSNPRLRALGFRRIVTASDMVAPYYERLGLGFRKDGASYVLDLAD